MQRITKQTAFEMSDSLKNRLKEVEVDGVLLDLEKIKSGVVVPIDNLRVDKSEFNFRLTDGTSFKSKIKGGEWTKTMLIDNKEKMPARKYIIFELIIIAVLLAVYLLRPNLIHSPSIWAIALLTTPIFYILQHHISRYGIIFRK